MKELEKEQWKILYDKGQYFELEIEDSGEIPFYYLYSGGYDYSIFLGRRFIMCIDFTEEVEELGEVKFMKKEKEIIKDYFEEELYKNPYMLQELYCMLNDHDMEI